VINSGRFSVRCVQNGDTDRRNITNKGETMTIYKTKGNLAIYTGDGMARGLFIAFNKKTGACSMWDNCPDFTLADCIY
jgi:hypothetical protein